MSGRFRILPEHLDDALGAFAKIGIQPLRIHDEIDGTVVVEIGELTDAQGQALAASFQPQWSAIVGIVSGHPFETKH